MRTYRKLFQAREFTPLFVTVSLQNAGRTMSGLVLGLLVHSTTGRWCARTVVPVATAMVLMAVLSLLAIAVLTPRRRLRPREPWDGARSPHPTASKRTVPALRQASRVRAWTLR